MKLGITGHRPQKMFGFSERDPLNEFLIKSIGSFIKKNNPEFLITGLALGVDQWAAQWAIALNIPVIGIIPSEGQEKRWPKKSQEKYKKILKNVKDIRMPEKSSNKSFSDLLQERNEMIVDTSDEMLGVYGGGLGGTKNCLDYALKRGKKISIINPGDYYNRV